MKIICKIHIDSKSIVLNDQPITVEGEGSLLLKEAYHKYIGNYSKFFKMDPLCRLGFIASELLLKDEGKSDAPREDRAVILFNQHSSVAADKAYAKTITQENYYPSPATFVYTLPNIVTGEIAIRHHYQGETSFYILDHRDEAIMKEIVEEAFADPITTSALTGWIEAIDENHFEADLILVEEDPHNAVGIA